MRYLYGDSVSFPLQFNFLATLEAFMASATRVVMLEAETQKQSVKAGQQSVVRIQAIESVEGLHERVMAGIREALDQATSGPKGTMVLEAVEEPMEAGGHPPVLVEYTRRLMDFAERFIEEQRGSAKHATERDASDLRADVERRAIEVKAEIEQFFKVARMQVLGTRFAMKLRETTNAIGAVFLNPDGIVSHFELSTARAPAWQHPRKVSEFVPGTSLLIGAKKAFFNKTVTPEAVALDEFIVSRFDVAPESFEVALRRKIDQKDAYVIRLALTKMGVAGDVDRLDDPSARQLPAQLLPSDVAAVEQLWHAIRGECALLMDQKERLTKLELDGKDVFTERLALDLVRRLVGTFAATTKEVAARSPSAEELSLKTETEDGRREEIYLKKEEIFRKLQPLPASGREVFAPLGLESWVPAVSMRPPPVRTG